MTMNKIRIPNIVGSMLLSVAMCSVGCTRKITGYTYCDAYTNKDSLIECVLTSYDAEACDALDLCHNDTNSVLYSILVADSSRNVAYYDIMRDAEFIERSGHNCGLSDTAKLFYQIKYIAMGGFQGFDCCLTPKINFPDTIYNILLEAFHRYGVAVRDKDVYRSEYNNLDSLISVILANTDTKSYDKLRLLISVDSLLPIAIEIAEKTHYSIACYDIYYDIVRKCRVEDDDGVIRRRRMSDDEFQFAYQYLCEAADSVYYPAVFLKASLCLTGTYFPPDTILGKKLLEQCHGSTSIPFWQQYFKPVVYGHLLKNRRDTTK